MRLHADSLEPRQLLSLAPVGPAVTVPGSSPAVSFDLAVADDGSWVVATLVATAPAAPLTLMAQRYSAAGAPVGEPLTLATGLNPHDISASIDADGDAVVAYLKDDGIYAMLVSKTNTLSAPVQIAAPPASQEVSLYGQAVSMDDGGGFFAAWTTFDSIEVRAFDAAGVPRGPQFTATAADRVSIVTQPQIASRADGGGAVYTAVSNTDVGSFIRFGRVDTAGVLSGEFGDGTITPGNAYASSLAVHDDGSFVLAYQRIVPFVDIPTGYAGYAQRVSAQGVPIGEEIEIAAALPGASPDAKKTHRPDVAATPGGGFVTSFVQSTGDVDRVHVHRFNAAGIPDGDGPVALDITEAPFETFGSWPTPAVGVDANGTVTIAEFPASDGPISLRRLADNLITLERGALTIFGSEGDDTIRVEIQDANVVVTRASASHTVPAADVQFISINALGGNDRVTNDTSLPSTLSGGEGDDTIFGGDGRDRIRGEGGRDSLWGRDGNDTIFGDSGVDSLYGNGGNDRIDGGANSDHIRGNAGRDKLFGGHGNDRIYGGPSADWLYGWIGDDQLFGEGSNDILYGEGGADTLHGLAGDDLLVSNNDGSIDELIGGRGRDTAIADASDILFGVEVVP